jgi:hypothetical protein
VFTRNTATTLDFIGDYESEPATLPATRDMKAVTITA